MSYGGAFIIGVLVGAFAVIAFAVLVAAADEDDKRK